MQCCPTNNQHNSFILPCGHGKTMSVMIPVAFEKMYQLFCGCRIIIVPYGFLMCCLFESMHANLAKLQVTIETCDGSDITPHRIPYATQDDLPNILIISLTAAYNLITHHADKLLQWGSSKFVRGVWVDEAQTVYEEFHFRSVHYNALPKLATFAIPVKLMSGSLTPSMMTMLMKYLCLHNIDEDRESQELITIGPQILLGCNFSLYIEIVIDIVRDTIHLIDGYMNEYGKSVHVICASKAICNQFQDLLTNDDRIAFVDGDTSPYNRHQIATKWYRGELKKLFTTTCGLVGNENKCVGAIFIVGVIYSLSNVHQAVGRLRPNYRGIHSKVYQIITVKDKQFQPENFKLALIESGLIIPKYENEYSRIFGFQGYIDFLNANECLVNFLCKQFEEKPIIACQRCSYCLQNSSSPKNPYIRNQNNETIHSTSSSFSSSCGSSFSFSSNSVINNNTTSPCLNHSYKRAVGMISDNDNIQNIVKKARMNASKVAQTTRTAITVLGKLKIRCYLCKMTNCGGTCQVRSKYLCFQCGGKHQSHQCSLAIKSKQRQQFDLSLKKKKIVCHAMGL